VEGEPVSDARSLIDPVRSFLAAPRCAALSTLAPDGAPRLVVIHYTLAEDHVRLNGHQQRHWVANVRRDPRVALLVHDERDYLHYVSIRGRAAVVEEGEEAVAEAMRQAERYGEDPAGFATQPRVGFRLDPEHVHEYR
jgi:PPOX class probable F420-dependent enzyme